MNISDRNIDFILTIKINIWSYNNSQYTILTMVLNNIDS